MGMPQELLLLSGTAVSIGLIHTLTGPDHYLPFIFIARARRWSLWKTGWITFLCGLGHVGSSVVLGLVGIAVGLALSSVQAVEAFRGDVAAWLLVAFGLVYCVWGVRRAWHGHGHSHGYSHGRSHPHAHGEPHPDRADPLASVIPDHGNNHPHGEASDEGRRINITPWVLFTIFVFGPCEPLIPIVMYPASKGDFAGVALVTALFGGATIATMLTVVTALTFGFHVVRLGWLERYSHGLAGAAVAVCGAMILLLGL